MNKAERKLTEYMKAHLGYLQEVASLLDLSEEQVAQHDASKFSEEEFPAYARERHGEGGDSASYARAWLHHMHNNPHHWQHWILPGKPVHGDVKEPVVEMPRKYILEMVADWLAANMAKLGTWDLKPWLKENLNKIKLHPKSREQLNEILRSIGL